MNDMAVSPASYDEMTAANFDTIDASDGTFSVTWDTDGQDNVRSMDGQGNYNWTINDADGDTVQSFQVSDDGSSHRERVGEHSTTINADGSFTLTGHSLLGSEDQNVLHINGDGTWTLNDRSPEEFGEDTGHELTIGRAMTAVGLRGEIYSDGTFDVTREDGTREFRTADGVYGYTDTDGTQLQTDGDGGFIHQNAEGDSLWKTAKGDIGTTENGYSTPIDSNGVNQTGSVVPYAGLRDGFALQFQGYENLQDTQYDFVSTGATTRPVDVGPHLEFNRSSNNFEPADTGTGVGT